MGQTQNGRSSYRGYGRTKAAIYVGLVLFVGCIGINHGNPMIRKVEGVANVDSKVAHVLTPDERLDYAVWAYQRALEISRIDSSVNTRLNATLQSLNVHHHIVDGKVYMHLDESDVAGVDSTTRMRNASGN